jgi:hypothetical protein
LPINHRLRTLVNEHLLESVATEQLHLPFVTVADVRHAIEVYIETKAVMLQKEKDEIDKELESKFIVAAAVFCFMIYQFIYTFHRILGNKARACR